MSSQQSKFDKALQLHHSGMPQEAMQIYRDILRKDKNNPYLLFLLGTALSQTGNPKEGIRYLQKSSDLSPNPITYNNIGTTYAKINKNHEAIDAFNKAISLVPSYAEAYSNRGAALRNLGQLEESLESCDCAIRLEPNYADAYNNRGDALHALKLFDEALVSYDKAIALKPDYAEAYSNRGIVLQELKRFDDALADHNRAIALKPDYAEAYSNRGIVLQELKRLDEALADYKTAFQFKSDIKFLLGTMLHTKMQLCDWKGFGDNLDLLESEVHNL